MEAIERKGERQAEREREKQIENDGEGYREIVIRDSER